VGGTIGGRNGEGDRAQADGGARRGNRRLVVDIAFAGFWETGRDPALEVGDDFGRGVAVEGRVR